MTATTDEMVIWAQPNPGAVMRAAEYWLESVVTWAQLSDVVGVLVVNEMIADGQTLHDVIPNDVRERVIDVSIDCIVSTWKTRKRAAILSEEFREMCKRVSIKCMGSGMGPNEESDARKLVMMHLHRLYQAQEERSKAHAY